MKAKEYIEKYYQTKGPKESLCHIVVELFMEVECIANTRHAETNIALSSIFKEQNQKWNAILKKVNYEPNNWFKIYAIEQIPEMITLF